MWTDLKRFLRHGWPVLLMAAVLIAAPLLASCAITVEPIRAICRGDSVNADWQDTALAKCSTLDSLARR